VILVGIGTNFVRWRKGQGLLSALAQSCTCAYTCKPLTNYMLHGDAAMHFSGPCCLAGIRDRDLSRDQDHGRDWENSAIILDLYSYPYSGSELKLQSKFGICIGIRVGIGIRNWIGILI
jgi:hypothetical protein